MELSLGEIRRLFLHRQGLLRANQFGRGRQAALQAIRRKSYVQIDTISVVLRAHEHALLSRVDNFNGGMLQRLHDERQIYEYWSHAAAFLPFEHFRYSLPMMRGYAASRQHDRKLAREIIARIRAEGPLQSRDFEDARKGQGGGWWDWKPAKRALQYLFLSGELMVARREGFQKVFGLPEDIIPPGTDTRVPDQAQWCRHLALSMARALGVATGKDLAYALPNIRQLSGISLQAPFKAALAELCEEGLLTPVMAEGQTWYSTGDMLASLPLRARRGEVKPLSPFDNLVINRARLLRLFGFDYQIECYLPAAKRRYGYFSLPLLWGDALVGRMDAKAERRARLLVINNLALEEGVRADAALLDALAAGIVRFAAANGCDCAQVKASVPAGLKRALNPRLQA